MPDRLVKRTATEPLSRDVSQRRRVLAGLAGAAALPATLLQGALLPAALLPTAAHAADTHGRINPPQPAPQIDLLRNDGTRTTLDAMLRGHPTAVQFMFTSCSATCPIQGAVFAGLQQQLATAAFADVRLLSLSIDALGDDPPALARWLKKFDAGARWQAAVPVLPHARRMTDWVGAAPGGRDTHTTDVLIFDAQARLVWRTFDMPDPADVARVLGWIQARRFG